MPAQYCIFLATKMRLRFGRECARIWMRHDASVLDARLKCQQRGKLLNVVWKCMHNLRACERMWCECCTVAAAGGVMFVCEPASDGFDMRTERREYMFGWNHTAQRRIFMSVESVELRGIVLIVRCHNMCVLCTYIVHLKCIYAYMLHVAEEMLSKHS